MCYVDDNTLLLTMLTTSQTLPTFSSQLTVNETTKKLNIPKLVNLSKETMWYPIIFLYLFLGCMLVNILKGAFKQNIFLELLELQDTVNFV